ncbi:hypothetical protein OJ997_13150 [Solirubrobacter phytolaccae]|uniref:Uncharacterized protein n=1 Tax=Solirubrobacter phytolaccae TaxID=1404360 RepID=A0A9X3S8B1_9ACTN|nr:hypothetical protein [Solirubrobacter phytolaccae]MDA0181248.1 hypothetical protein [Solirubrobacter phytolaccae]
MSQVLLALLLAVGAFVFWHTGGRAGTLCERERFVPGGDLSLWPPGAACTYGEPSTTDVFVNPWFLGTVLVLGVFLAVIQLSGAVKNSSGREAT